LGILFGVGFYYPAIVATGMTLITLSLFRLVEARMPTQFYAQHLLRFRKDETLAEPAVRRLIEGHHFTISNMSYRLNENGAVFEYRMVIRTVMRENLERLAMALRARATTFWSFGSRLRAIEKCEGRTGTLLAPSPGSNFSPQ
jgi:putative Mg2+ transporter-C (MgtC) family protein